MYMSYMCQVFYNPYSFYLKMSSAFYAAAYIQMHFRPLLVMEGNTMNPDQTAPKSDLDP